MRLQRTSEKDSWKARIASWEDRNVSLHCSWPAVELMAEEQTMTLLARSAFNFARVTVDSKVN